MKNSHNYDLYDYYDGYEALAYKQSYKSLNKKIITCPDESGVQTKETKTIISTEFDIELK